MAAEVQIFGSIIKTTVFDSIYRHKLLGQRYVMLRNLRCFVCFVICLCCAQSGAIAGPGSKSMVAQLSELPVLPKVHYSWPIADKSLSDDLLEQYVRVTHAFSIRGQSHDPGGRQELKRIVRRASKILGQVNSVPRERPATLALNYSVWHYKFPAGVAPTVKGRIHDEELTLLDENLKRIVDELASIELTTGNAPEVSAVLFDSERFSVNFDRLDSAWNDAIAEKHIAAYKIARKYFPEARIEWFARGCWVYDDIGAEWKLTHHLTLKEPGVSLGCYLYTAPYISESREMLVRTGAEAAKRGITEVTPWVALASGYKPQSGANRKWLFNWNYEPVYSEEMGKLVNSEQIWGSFEGEVIPNMANVAIFYPEPFGRAVQWFAHFKAYVKGSTEEAVKIQPQ